jgi:hypothetical protein
MRALHLRWYVFGAQAVAVHGFPRATADLDVTVDLADVAPERLVRRLESAGFASRFSDAELVRATRVMPIVHEKTGLPIDVVLAGPGLEQVFLDAAETHRIGRCTIPVISREHLIVTKLLAGRPKDLEDVRELIAIAGADLDSLTSKHCSLSSNARSARAICDLAFVTFDDYAGLDDHNGRDHTRW